MTLIEKIVPLIRSLVNSTGASCVSLGLNREHCAITLMPKRAVGPRRLRKLIERALAILPGFGLGTRFEAVHMIYNEGPQPRSARLYSQPVALPGYPTVSSGVLPEALPIVAEDDAPPYALRAVPATEPNGLITVRLVEAISAGELSLPHLLAAPASPIETDVGLAPPGDVPRLRIGRNGRPAAEI